MTKETFTALCHTTRALIEISDYCIQELGAKYVLLGKFQTCCLEARVGQYRQLARGNYDVSLRQIYECEKKIHLLSVLNLQINGKEVSLTNFAINWDEFIKNTSSESKDIPILILFEEWENVMQYHPVITYIAGYCAFSASKKLKCEECREQLTSTVGEIQAIEDDLISKVTRGGLFYPSSDIVQMVMINYIVVDKLSELAEFHFSMSQRQLIFDTTMRAIEAEELNSFIFKESCKNNHDSLRLAKFILWASTNITTYASVASVVGMLAYKRC